MKSYVQLVCQLPTLKDKNNIIKARPVIPTIISFIIIGPWIIYFYPPLEHLAIKSSINSGLCLSFLAFKIIRRKSFNRKLKQFWEFIFRALADTTIPKTAHTIIRPERTVTPQLNLIIRMKIPISNMEQVNHIFN